MISVIVSSPSPLQERFQHHVSQTIGLSCEIIWIENFNRFSLTHAYNLGAKKATFPYLVFVHDDVQFLTQGWGNEIINLLTVKTNGLVGLAGSKYFGPYQAGWWGFPCGKNHRYRIKQGQGAEAHWIECRPADENHSQVVVLDGVFLATRKEIWEEFPWDEALPGFHGYDLDYSLQIGQKYAVVVTYTIDLHHESKGKLTTSWVQGLEYVWKKWKDKLPIHLHQVTEKNLEQWNINNATFLIYAFILNDISKAKIATTAFKCFFSKKLALKPLRVAMNYVLFSRKNDFLLQRWQQNLYES